MFGRRLVRFVSGAVSGGPRAGLGSAARVDTVCSAQVAGKSCRRWGRPPGRVWLLRDADKQMESCVPNSRGVNAVGPREVAVARVAC